MMRRARSIIRFVLLIVEVQPFGVDAIVVLADGVVHGPVDSELAHVDVHLMPMPGLATTTPLSTSSLEALRRMSLELAHAPTLRRVGCAARCRVHVATEVTPMSLKPHCSPFGIESDTAADSAKFIDDDLFIPAALEQAVRPAVESAPFRPSENQTARSHGPPMMLAPR